MISNSISLSKTNTLWKVFVLLHLLVITASNYLVQIPIYLFGFATNLGTFSFPIIFLLSDLAVRIYGAKKAREIVYLALFPALILSYLVSILFISGSFTSLSELSAFNFFVFRIVLASFLAYLIGQILDIAIFSLLKKVSFWFFAPLVSTTIGSLIDTFSFYTIAFYQSNDEFMRNNWLEMASFDYAFKMLVSILIFIPIYKLLINQLADRLKK